MTDPLPTRREARLARGEAPPPPPDDRTGGGARWTSRGVPVLLAACAAAVLVSSLTLPARPDAAAATAAPASAATSSRPAGAVPAGPAAGTSSASPHRTTTRPTTTDTTTAHDGTRVTVTLRSRPRSRTDQEFGVVGRHLGTVVLDDPARPDGDAARRSATFDTGRGGFVLAWRSRDGWTLESLACTTTDGNLATSVRSTVVVVTAGRGEVRCTAVVAKA